MSRQASFIAAASYAARRAVWLLLRRHRPGKAPPILVLTSRRSGGTWLTDALAAENGLLCVLQPFAIGLSDPILRFDGGFPASLRDNLAVPIRPDDESWMPDFFERILSGRLRIGWPANPLGSRFQARTDRVLVKIHNAKAWIDWFEERFPEAHIAVHFRHPIPQALSSMRMGWPDRTLAYLRDRRFVEEHLTPELEEAARATSASGSAFEKTLVGWLIENRAPLRLLERTPGPRWLVTTYEETVANPRVVFERLIARLELRCGEAILERARLPSHTVFDADKARLIRQAAGDAAHRSSLIGGWRQQVSEEQVEQAVRLFQLFGLKAYRADSPFPAASLRLSPDSFDGLGGD